MKGVYIFIADGFEDCEALATNDALRRAGIESRLVSVSDSLNAVSSHGVRISCDVLLEDLLQNGQEGTDAKDFLIFPGGMPGSRNLAGCGKLVTLMQEHYDAGGALAAICASPGLVLSRLDNVDGLEFTCFDGFEGNLTSRGASFNPQPSVVCGRIITGRSAGHSLSFALDIIRAIKGGEAAGKVDYALYLQ